MGISVFVLPYCEEEAKIQAQRCLKCHRETIFDWDKCILCNNCVEICPEFCLNIVPVKDLQMEGVDSALATCECSANETVSAMIKDDEKCIRCGLCAIICPTGAMIMEEFAFKEVNTEEK
jgi:formate hydrogenlyase subunit 6/NADH:ubiquinone oxidoreductase subunit I